MFTHSDLLRRFATKPLALAISCALLASLRDLPQVFLGALTPGNGTSGLHAACRKGNLKVVQFFLQSNRHGREWIISILFQGKSNMGKARDGGPTREQWYLFAMAMVKKGGSVIVMRRWMSACASARSKRGVETCNPPQSESTIKNCHLIPFKPWHSLGP